MGCTSCGTNPMMVNLLITNAITEAIKDGTLQAGLAKCGDQIER